MLFGNDIVTGGDEASIPFVAAGNDQPTEQPSEESKADESTEQPALAR